MEPPYQSLIDLCRELRGQRFAALANPDEETQILLTNWCARNGLLGVLPQSVFTIVLAARWDHLLAKEGPLFPVVDQHVRSSTDWQTGHFHYGFGRRRPSGEERRQRDLVEEEYVSEKSPPPHVIIQSKLDDPKLEHQSLKSLAHFFPEVKEWEAETFDYPRPLSVPFWELYAEPIHNFLAAAFGFYDSVQTITRLAGTPPQNLEERDYFSYTSAVKTIEALVANVRHTVGFTEDGQMIQRWTSASLLASFGMMAFLDLTEGKVHRCANESCGRLFVTDAWQAAYCSPRCRNTTLKRESRKRVAARQMHAAGKSFGQVAKRFGVDVTTVKEWVLKKSDTKTVKSGNRGTVTT